jgi:truncated hemoglobin YjbI
MPADLANRDDVERLVVAFYETAFRDPLVGPIFTDVAHMDLAAHLPIMCDFWETVLFRTGAYRRNALQVHVVLHERHPLTDAHFTRWLQLWTATVDELFAGPAAERAKLQATRIAGSMVRRLAGGSGSAFETVGRRGDG